MAGEWIFHQKKKYVSYNRWMNISSKERMFNIWPMNEYYTRIMNVTDEWILYTNNEWDLWMNIISQEWLWLMNEYHIPSMNVADQ